MPRNDRWKISSNYVLKKKLRTRIFLTRQLEYANIFTLI